MMHEVLWRLEEYDLYLKPEKCKFDYDRIEYLGMIIEPGCVSMDHGKVATVANWLKPCNLRDVQGFLGFANFYHWSSRTSRPRHDRSTISRRRTHLGVGKLMKKQHSLRLSKPLRKHWCLRSTIPVDPPASIEINHEEEFEVEDIIDSCMFRRQLQYLVR